jgi:IMP cyclohydrolase
MVPEDWSDEVLINTDYERMEVNAVFVSAYTDSGESPSIEYKGPETDEWTSVETVERRGEKALSYGFYEGVDEPGDYRFRASAYEMEISRPLQMRM